MKGHLLQIQPFSVNDGDGIRTTIFLAGCPLQCQWCSNPEGFDQMPKVGYYEKFCVGCGACVAVCPHGIGIDLNEKENREKCDGCGACAKVCLKGARKSLVEIRSVEEIVSEVKKHKLFFQKSGGGVTFSGGEATGQVAFLDELSQELYDIGIDLALETCGLFDFERVKPILDRMDLIFMDLKSMDDSVHRTFTGVSNERILDNMKRLRELKAQVVIRIPVIVGVNAEEENIKKSGAFVARYLPEAKLELLPYHEFGIGKYEALGLKKPSVTFSTPTKDAMERYYEILTEQGVQLIEYR